MTEIARNTPGAAGGGAAGDLLAGVPAVGAERPHAAVVLLNLLVIHQVPGVGRRRVLELVDQSPGMLSDPVNAPFWNHLERRLKISVPHPERDLMVRGAERILEEAGKADFGILHLFGPAYPPLLKELYDPPLVLFHRGDAGLLTRPCIAVVGARKSSDYGVAVAQDLSLRLAKAGLVVVSGMALGADSSAHVGALKAGGKTVAVLGSGVDVPYPRQAAAIYRRICGEGCVVSEFPPGTWAAPQNFPIRNRLISGLCLGTVIVEATERSGSLITARLALEQGRELFAVPGPVHSPLSVGPNYLIKQGAKLVQVWQDVVEELPAGVRDKLAYKPLTQAGEALPVATLSGAPANHPLTSEEKRVYNLLFFDRKVHLETLLEQAGFSAGALAGILLKLQFDGLILEVPGQYFIRNVRNN